ncbi:MAG: DNA polymerase III subunit gamma/tau [Pirellulaceae bacterium]|nr:DNA polymerase III subunit gamma/tau [Pirellulaceae bacterium]
MARRYRPKSFDELIGQEHVSQALATAIASGRVGHAYLFTGARGVGKTSTARIFAKALSIPAGSPPELSEEISAAIDSGDDMDVIEIDGASNRRIEEIRQLRANVSVRPSRARFKIYIIDEVHMLTKEAFNALLKTLEEPPEHVKFIFCTTDPEKIPITILSRCQRFDFAPVKFEAIQQRLLEIAEAEGYQIEPAAVALLARRASGSMRDSQSLLEQVMSFSSGTITADQVHSLLGTADEGSLLEIVDALYRQDALQAICRVEQAVASGADAGQVAEQLLNYLRDLMAVGVGGGPELLKFANPISHSQLVQLATAWGLQTVLTAIQILDEALVRMRSSVSAMTLLEVSLVQICQLQQLTSIPALLEALRTQGSQNSPQKKSSVITRAESKTLPVQAKLESDASPAKAELDTPVPTELATTSQSPLALWQQATRNIAGILADYCSVVEAVDAISQTAWRVVFPAGATQPRDYCEHPSRKAELCRVVHECTGRAISLNFEVQAGPPPAAPVVAPTASSQRNKRQREAAEHPLIKVICEVLQADVVRVHGDSPPPPSASPHLNSRQSTQAKPVATASASHQS